MKAVIAIAGCKNSGKSSLCRYISFLVARVDGLINGDPLSGSFSNKHPAQVPRDGGKKVYITNNGSTYHEALLSKEPNVEVLSFAGPLKEICTDVLGLSGNQVYGTEDDKNSSTKYMWENMPVNVRDGYGLNKSGAMTAREVMQVLGTDMFRTYFNNNIWVDCLVDKTDRSKADVVLIDDLRFNSEAITLMQKGAMIMHLQRKWKEGGSHKSENGLDLSIFEGYSHFYSIPDVDMTNKNEIAFKSIKEYFQHVICTQSNICEQV